MSDGGRKNSEYKKWENCHQKEHDQSEEDCWKSETEKREDSLQKEHRICLEIIRDNVKKMWKRPYEKPLAYYTTHGPSHCFAVENLIYKLIPSFTRLKEEERFYLLASAWLHDIGMLHFVANELNTHSGQIELNDSEIRDRHHSTSERYIIEYYDKCGLDHKINNIDHTEDKLAISKICRYHRKRENIDDCPEKLPIRNEEYRVQLLAAYLRLADALHIDSSRAPDYAYAICLAYDIPPEIKMHWIKSKIVQGVIIDPNTHRITVSFRMPTLEQLKERNIDDPSLIFDKIDYIIKEVMNDLHNELASVMHVHALGGLSYYFDIRAEKVSGYIERQLMNDLLSMVINYDILSNPSASNLVELVLMSIANISGYYLKEGTSPIPVSKISCDEIKNEVAKFLEELKKSLLSKRTCHFGLKRLTELCIKLNYKMMPKNLDVFIKEINMLYQAHFKRKKRIRDSARIFCKELLKENTSENVNEIIYHIILYGYSNLVVQALCGFRDSLILKKYDNSETEKQYNIYNSDTKKMFSKQFRIFVCDGQPKKHLSLTNGVLYHDGFSIANALIKSDFTDVILIPDIIAGNIIEENEIDFIMMGANGFDNEKFRHSAGHTSIIKFNEYLNLKNDSEKDSEKNLKKPRIPSVILVVTSDKFEPKPKKRGDSSECEPNLESECEPNPEFKQRSFGKHTNIMKEPEHEEVSGFRFWKPVDVAIRSNIWFSNYDEINNIKENVYFYNPREDSISLENVDYIISDIGNFHKEIYNVGLGTDLIQKDFLEQLNMMWSIDEIKKNVKKKPAVEYIGKLVIKLVELSKIQNEKFKNHTIQELVKLIIQNIHNIDIIEKLEITLGKPDNSKCEIFSFLDKINPTKDELILTNAIRVIKEIMVKLYEILDEESKIILIKTLSDIIAQKLTIKDIELM